MVTYPNEWKILKWDENPQNKQTKSMWTEYWISTWKLIDLENSILNICTYMYKNIYYVHGSKNDYVYMQVTQDIFYINKITITLILNTGIA